MWGSNSEEVRLADLGVRADGVTDNASVLLALREELRATSVERHWRIVCPPGELRYSDARWLQGLQNFTLVGYGTRLVSTSTSAFSTFKHPVFGGDVFWTNSFTFSGAGWAYNGGHLFRSAPAGATTIALSTLGDASGFAPGQRVLLGGYDQQGSGYPLNLRFFDWKTISAVDTGTGVLTLTEPLLNGYDETWHDVPNLLGTGNGSGKPRVWLIDRDPTTVSYPKHAEFLGLTLGLSTTPDGGGVFRGAFYFPAEVLRATDVTVEGQTWPSGHRVAEYTDCTFLDTVEPDKLCDTVRFVRPKFGSHVLAATGVNDLVIEGGSAKGYLEVAPRRLTLKGLTLGSTDANPSVAPYPLLLPVEHMTLDGVRFAGAPTMTSTVHVQGLGQWRNFTISAVSGTSICVPFTGYTDVDVNWTLLRALGFGARLQKSDGSKTGAITSITFDDATTRWKVAGTWTTPVAGETWSYRLVGEILTHHVKALDGRALWDAGTAAIVGSPLVSRGGGN